MSERRVYAPEMGLWKGENIGVAEHTVIPHTTSPVEVPVVIFQNNRPSRGDWYLGQRIPLKVSVRSKFAQAGLDIDHINPNDLLLKGLRRGESFETSVEVINRGSQPIETLPGTGLFRLYAEKSPALKGYALEKLLQDGKIKIAGSREAEWDWAFDEDGTTPIGIYVNINAGNRRWMPPHPDNKPLVIDDKVKDYRGVLDSYLEDVPLGRQDDILWIGETARLTLKGVNGVLDQVTHTHLDPDNSIGFGKQINSRLIDENTDWRIRVEILSKTTWGKMPNFARIRFFRTS